MKTINIEWKVFLRDYNHKDFYFKNYTIDYEKKFASCVFITRFYSEYYKFNIFNRYIKNFSIIKVDVPKRFIKKILKDRLIRDIEIIDTKIIDNQNRIKDYKESDKSYKTIICSIEFDDKLLKKEKQILENKLKNRKYI